MDPLRHASQHALVLETVVSDIEYDQVKVPLDGSEGRGIVMTNMSQHVEPMLSGVEYEPSEAHQASCVGVGHLYPTSSMTKSSVSGYRQMSPNLDPSSWPI